MSFLKKKGRVFFLCLFSLAISPLLAGAIGISPADAYLQFVPNHEYVIDYSVSGYRDFEFYTTGAFSEYTRVETLSKNDRSGKFRVYITLPEDYDPPGKHRMYVAAKEKPTPGAVNTIAAIRGFVEIDVPYPGYYAVIGMSVKDVNEGEPIPITVKVSNKGKKNISDARLQLSITSDSKVIKTINSESFAVETNGAYAFQTVIPGDELKPGVYDLKADLFYEGDPKDETAVFRVGTFDVEIVNYTKEMFNNSVNLFEIEVESKWNNRIDTVFMDLRIMNGTDVLSGVKTPPFDLIPWQSRVSSLYWNTEGIPVGEYTLDIMLHYDGETKKENRKIYIVEPLPPEEEKPAMPVSTVILLVIAVMLVIFNVYFVMQRKRRKKKDDGG